MNQNSEPFVAWEGNDSDWDNDFGQAQSLPENAVASNQTFGDASERFEDGMQVVYLEEELPSSYFEEEDLALAKETTPASSSASFEALKQEQDYAEKSPDFTGVFERPAILVADDNGYAAHKLAWYDDQGLLRTAKIPSVVSMVANAATDTSGTPDNNSYTVDGVLYSCKPNPAYRMNIRNSEYPTSVANRVLLTHALNKNDLLGRPIELAVTLPFRDYFLVDGSKNEELRQRTSKNFMGNAVLALGVQQKAQIKNVSVFAEALCTWYDWALDDQGYLARENDEINQSMAIVDIGGSTTNICALDWDDRILVDNDVSGTEKVGVLNVRELLEPMILKRLAQNGQDLSGHDQGLPAWLVDAILEKGVARYMGIEWDMRDLRNCAIDGVAGRVVSFIKTRLGNLNRYQTILIVGGGACVFRAVLKEHLPTAELSDEFANARGALKYLKSCQEE